MSYSERKAADARKVARRNQLIEQNLGAMYAEVHEYQRRNPKADRDDVVGAAGLCAVRAMDYFDPGRGFQPQTYLRASLRHSMPREIHGGRRLTTKRPAITPASVLDEKFLAGIPARVEDADERLDLIPDLVATLPPRLRKSIVMRFGLDGAAPMTRRQIAEHYGVNLGTVTIWQGKALAELRRRLEVA